MKQTSLNTLATLGFVALLPWATVVAEPSYEQASVVSATSILSPAVIKGPNHTVQDAVHNDGYLNIYDLETQYGPLRVVSTATLYQTIAELNAMSGMEKLKGTDEFKAGIAEQADNFVEGGVALVKHPVDSLSGAASGVASVFHSVGATMRHGKSDTEGGRLSTISGFDKTKREYAERFKVDVYSRNPYLQDELNEISRAGFLGSSIVRLGSAAVSGGAGLALSVTGNVEALNELLYTKSAGDVRVHNEETLQALGASADVIELFLENRNFTISEQAALVMALAHMPNAANRASFVKFATLTDNADMAAFRARQAGMYAAYNRGVAPLAMFDHLGQVSVARNKANVIVLQAPLDNMMWTQDTAGWAGFVTARVDALPDVKGKELWVAGTVSQRTAQELGKMGWKIVEHADTQLAAK